MKFEDYEINDPLATKPKAQGMEFEGYKINDPTISTMEPPKMPETSVVPTMTQPEPRKPTLGETVTALPRGIYHGLTRELPGMIGSAMEYSGIAPETGKEIKEKVGYEDRPEEYQTPWTPAWALYEGGRMLAPSVIPGGLLTKGASVLTKADKLVKAAKATGAAADIAKAASAISKSQNIGAGGAGILFGLSQAQSTYESAMQRAEDLERSGDIRGAAEMRDKANGIAPKLTGLIEAVGEYYGTKYLGRLLGLTPTMEAAMPFTKRLLKTLGVEVGTEVGQSVGQSIVEKAADIRPDARIAGEALEVIPPTIVMTLLTGGLAGAVNRRPSAKRTEPNEPVDMLKEGQPGEPVPLTPDEMERWQQYRQFTPVPQYDDKPKEQTVEDILNQLPEELPINTKPVDMLRGAQTTPQVVPEYLAYAEPERPETGFIDVPETPGMMVEGAEPPQLRQPIPERYAGLQEGLAMGRPEITPPMASGEVVLPEEGPIKAISPNLIEYLTREVFKGKSLDAAINKVHKTFNNAENVMLGTGKIQFTKDELKQAYVQDKINTYYKQGIPEEKAYLAERFKIPEESLSVLDKPIAQTSPIPQKVESPKVDVLPETTAKEPWEMTRAEYAKQYGIKDTNHGAYVAEAVDRGEAVPPEVLKDYPDLQQAGTVDQQAHEAATSPINVLPLPTKAQIEAGNYKKGHVNIQGLDISIENPEGSVRSGTDKEGKPWKSTLKSHYGYILGTKGRDKDHIDAFIGKNPDSEQVFVVNQVDPKTGKFDEHKIMLGFNTRDEAIKGYEENYQEGWQGLGSITPMSMPEFKDWLKKGDTKQEAAPVVQAKAAKKSAPNINPYNEEVARFLKTVREKSGITYNEPEVFKAASKIAEMDNAKEVEVVHLSEAIQYRGNADDYLAYFKKDEVENKSNRKLEDIKKNYSDILDRAEQVLGGDVKARAYKILDDIYPEGERASLIAKIANLKSQAKAESERKLGKTGVSRLIEGKGTKAQIQKANVIKEKYDKQIAEAEGRIKEIDGETFKDKPIIHNDEPVTQAEAKEILQDAGNKQAKTTLKEQKTYLLSEIDKAIGDAKPTSELPQDLAGKVIIEIPGDGTFSIFNTKEALSKFREIAKKEFPEKEEYRTKTREVPLSGDALIDSQVSKAIELYGDARKAYEKVSEGKGENRQEQNLIDRVSARLLTEAEKQEKAGILKTPDYVIAEKEKSEQARKEYIKKEIITALDGATDLRSLSGEKNAYKRMRILNLVSDKKYNKSESGLHKTVGAVERFADIEGDTPAERQEAFRQWLEATPDSVEKTTRETQKAPASQDKGTVIAQIKKERHDQSTGEPYEVIVSYEVIKGGKYGYELHRIGRRGEDILYDDLMSEASSTKELDIPYETDYINAEKFGWAKNKWDKEQGAKERLTQATDEYNAETIRLKEKYESLREQGNAEYDKALRKAKLYKLAKQGQIPQEQLNAIQEPLKRKWNPLVDQAKQEYSDWLDNRNKYINQRTKELYKGLETATKEAEVRKEVKDKQGVIGEKSEEKIEDFGEKIGGARKDIAERGYTMTKKEKPSETAEAWRKKYVAMEKVDGSGWTIGKAGDSFGISASSSQKFATQEEAEKAIPLFAVADKHRVYEEKDKTFSIYKNVTDRKRIKVVNQSFPSREDAMKYMATHAEELLNLKTSFGEEILPVPEIATRKGVERRTTDATPEMFMETFAPRGIEFGNWNNQEERQMVMNHAYDGLLDMAEVLNVPPKALMLNGELAIAFGARGQGLTGAKAHYEIDYGIINLTKMKGAGSLAHEWFHALDHYLARLDTKASSEKVTNKRGDLVYKQKSDRLDMQSHGASYKSQLRQELKTKYDELIKSMYHKAEQFVEDTELAEKFLGKAKENLRDSLNNVRNGLTADYTQWKKRGGSPASVEQLAEFDRLADILVEGGNLDTSFKANEGKKPISRFGLGGRDTNDTLEAINALMKAVRNRQGFNSERTGQLDYVRYAMNLYKTRMKMFEDAKAGTEQTKRVPTRYAIEARKMDQARSGDYWSEPHEMAARAFASYVEDKIAEKGSQSDFLVYHAHGGILLPMIDGFIARPYPEGNEREAINKLFDDFIGEIKTEETEKGTALYSLKEESGNISQWTFDESTITKTEDDSEAIRTLIRELSNSHGGLTLPVGTYQEVQLSDPAAQNLREIGKSFGKEIIIFKAKEESFSPEGIYLPKLPGKVFINVKTVNPHLWVLGHELLHNLRNNYTKLYSDFLKEIRPFVKNLSAYQEALVEDYKSKNIQATITRGFAEEELLSDFVGSQFMDEAFWEKLHGKNPTLFERIIKIAKNLIDKVTGHLQAKKLIENDFFRDYQKAQSITAKYMAKYAIKEQDTSYQLSDTTRSLRFTQEELRDIVKEIQRIAAPGTWVQFRDRLEVDSEEIAREALAKWGKDLSASVRIKGRHGIEVDLKGEHFISIIELALEDMDKTTPYHEAWHSVRKLLLNKQEQAYLSSQFPNKGGVIGEELEADAFARYAVNRKISMPTMTKRLFSRIRMFLDKLRNYLNGKGFYSVEDIFRKGYEGKYRERMARAQGQEASYQIGPVYHGSPYKFDKFSDEKIGTGEGAQAFGYGHYLTDSVGVAQGYAENLAKAKDSSFKVDVLAAKKYLKDSNYTDELLRQIPEYPMNWRQLHGELKSKGIDVDDVWTALEKASHAKDISDNLYTATINKGKPASEDVFLEWDKPVGEQSAKVQQAIKTLGWDLDADVPMLKNTKWRDVTGARFYEALGGQRAASQRLGWEGITGIKYPSGTLSGVKDSQSYNYVVFNPADITIEVINGEPLSKKVESDAKELLLNNPDMTVTEAVEQAQGKEASYQLSDQTETEAFKKWFGNSVVTENGKAGGKPLVVYHGTTSDVDFTKFRRRANDIGIHFGTSGQANDRLAFLGKYNPDKRARVLPVYLHITNPLRVNDAGWFDSNNLPYELERTGLFTKEEIRLALRGKLNEQSKIAALRKLILSKGFDGLIYANTGETEGGADLSQDQAKLWEDFIKTYPQAKGGISVKLQQTDEYKAYKKAMDAYENYRIENAQDSYVAFYPTQIKSATGNRGTFDASNPDISYQISEENDNIGEMSKTPNMPEGGGIDLTGTKVIDLYGNPEKVYQGTSTDKSLQNRRRNVFWFTTNPKYAEYFAKEHTQGETPIVKSGYLSIKKPLIIDSSHGLYITPKEIIRQIKKQSKKMGEFTKEWLSDDKPDTEFEVYEIVDQRDYWDEVKSAGFDGFILKKENGHKDYVVFSKDQIHLIKPNEPTRTPKEGVQFLKTPDSDISYQVSDSISDTKKELYNMRAIVKGDSVTLFRGGNVAPAKLKRLRYGDYLSMVREGKDATGNSGASEYGKNVVEITLPIKDIQIVNGEVQYKGHSASLKGKKYPIEIYRAYNDVYGSNYTAAEIDALEYNEVRNVARQGLADGKEEFDRLMGKFKGGDTSYQVAHTPNPFNILKKAPTKAELGITDNDITKAIRLYSNPWDIAKRFPKFMPLIETQMDREQRRSETLLDFLKSPTKVREGQEHEFLTLKPEDRENIEPIQIYSDAQNEILHEKDLRSPAKLKEIESWFKDTFREDITIKPLTDEQVLGYYHWNTSMQKAWKMRAEHAEKMLFMPYEGRGWLDTLKAIYNEELTLDAAKSELSETDFRELKQAHDHISDDMAILTQLRNEMGQRKYYVPRRREEGRYVIRVYDGDNLLHSERTEDKMFDKAERLQAAAIRDSLQQEYPNSKVTVSLEKPTPESVYQELSDIAIERFVNKALEKAKNNEQINESDITGIRKALFDTMADELKARGWAKHMIRRLATGKGETITGYQTRKLHDVYVSYMSGFTGSLTKQEAAFHFMRNMKNIDIQKEKELYEYSLNYSRDMLRNKTDLDRLSGKASSLAFVWFLSGNLRMVPVQFTQNFVTGTPILSRETKNADAKYIKAMRDIALGKLTKEEQSVMDAAYNTNITQDQYIQDMVGRVKGTKFGQMFSKTLDILAYPFSAMEVFNRKAAFLVMYRVAKNELKLSDDAAFKKARGFVYDTHFLYGEANRPEWARGSSVPASIAKTAYIFRSFTHNYILGMKRSLQTPEGRLSVNVLGRSLAYLALFGGLTTMPFLDDLLEELERLTGIPYRAQMRAALRRTGGELLEKLGMAGVPALLGFDLSGSLKVGGIPRLSAEGLGESAIGVYGGIFQKFVRGIDAFSMGEWKRGIESMSPVAIENMMKAYREATTGATTAWGKVIFDEKGRPLKLTPIEAAGRSIGIRPESVAASSMKHRSYQNMQHRHAKTRNKLYDRYSLAKTPAERRKVLADVKEYNIEVAQYKGVVPRITRQSLMQSYKKRRTPDKKSMRFSRMMEIE